MAISVTEYAAGQVEPVGPGGKALSVVFPVDQGLADEIDRAAALRSIPVARVGYGGSSGPASCYPLDWGAIIPLWHLVGSQATTPRLMVVTPSRRLTWEDMVRFGEAVFDAVSLTDTRIGVVASADLAHAHLPTGPYGYDRAAAVFDQAVKDAVEAGDLLRLLAIDPVIVEAARPDGQWQILVLAGVLARARLRPVLLSYEVPTYFGMLCAACEPDETLVAQPVA
jgi:aromatic ring-opening dioxygenase LigB subunit